MMLSPASLVNEKILTISQRLGLRNVRLWASSGDALRLEDVPIAVFARFIGVNDDIEDVIIMQSSYFELLNASLVNFKHALIGATVEHGRNRNLFMLDHHRFWFGFMDGDLKATTYDDEYKYHKFSALSEISAIQHILISEFWGSKNNDR